MVHTKKIDIRCVFRNKLLYLIVANNFWVVKHKSWLKIWRKLEANRNVNPPRRSYGNQIKLTNKQKHLVAKIDIYIHIYIFKYTY